MPMYTFKCSKCGTKTAEMRKIAERDNTPACCGEQTARLIEAPMVSAMAWTSHKGFIAHNNDGSGTFIADSSDYKAFMAKNDLMPASEGHKHADQRKVTIKKERSARTRKYVEERVRALPT